MYEWKKQIQMIVDTIDEAIIQRQEDTLTLHTLAKQCGYSEFYMTRKFKEVSGMQFREYVRLRKLAYALKEVRDSEKSILEIALTYGYSSHEAFTRSFKATYGMTPNAYRKKPKPVVLRTKIHAFDRYFLGLGEIGMVKSKGQVKIYFVSIPAHKFLYIENRISNGYWDFWEKQNQIPEQDFDTICGLLDSVKGKLDDHGGSETNCGSGQIMAYRNDPNGRLCDGGYLRTECWGARLSLDYQGEIPPHMKIMDIPEAEYIVFEHGPFDYNQENRSVEEKIEQAMVSFDYATTDYVLDFTENRMMYFYYDPHQFFKYIRPVQRTTKGEHYEEMV